MRKDLTLLFLGLFLYGGPVVALDLRESYERAKHNDRIYRAAEAKFKAESEAVPQALSRFMPNISASASRSTIDQTRKDGVSVQDFPQYKSETDALTIRQPIFRPKDFFLYQQAERRFIASSVEFYRAEHELALRVAAAYFEHLIAKERLQLIRAQKKRLETQLQGAIRSFQLGVGLSTDVDEIRGQLATIVAQEIGGEQNFIITKSQLEFIVGSSISSVKDIPIPPSEYKRFSPPPLEELLKLALIHSPEIRLRLAQREGLQANLRAMLSEHSPTIDFVAQYSASVSDNPFFPKSEVDSRSLGFQLNIPLFSGGLTQSKVREAQSLYDEANERYLNAINETQIQVHKEYSALVQSIAEVDAFDKVTFSAEQALRSMEKGKSLGTRTLVDVVTAQQKTNQAYFDRLSAKNKMLFSYMRLQSLVGVNSVEGVPSVISLILLK